MKKSEHKMKPYIRDMTPDDQADMSEMALEIFKFCKERYNGRGAQVNTVLLHMLALSLPNEYCLDVACQILVDSFHLYHSKDTSLDS